MSAHQDKKPSLKEVFAIVESSNHKLTKPRQVLLKTILSQAKPFSAPKLMKVFKRDHACDLVTIYRSLAVFEELGIIEKCDFSDEMAHYEVASGPKGHHHHHIVCRTCKKVEPLDFCLVKGQEQALKKLGYTDLHHRLEFTGNCRACS